MIFSWGFIGNGRNVSICEQAWGWQGKPGWAVTWLRQDWLDGGQVAWGWGLVGLEQRTGISLIGDLVTLWA